MDLDILAYAALGAFALLLLRYWSRWRLRRLHAARQQAYARRRDELLHRLTFVFSSLRHIYTKYPLHRLPPKPRQHILDAYADSSRLTRGIMDKLR
jgi:hypothetical protein